MLVIPMLVNHRNSRQGITLLFVISMIVLFLLMGTAFVIVANNFYRESRNKIRNAIEDTRNDNGAQLLNQAAHMFIRGPELTDAKSPLRGHDLLSDQYGYGFKATVDLAAPVQTITGTDRQQLFRIRLSRATTTAIGIGTDGNPRNYNLRGLRNIYEEAFDEYYQGIDFDNDGNPDVFPPKDLVGGNVNANNLVDPGFSNPATDPFEYRKELDVPGFFNGQVMSFTDGPARGISARIVDYTVVIDSGNVTREFVIAVEPEPAMVGSYPFDNQPTLVNGVLTTEVTAIGRVLNGGGDLVNQPSTVIINGRPFSGYGAGITADMVRTPSTATANQEWRTPNHAEYPGNPLVPTALAPIPASASPPSAARPNDGRFDYQTNPNDPTTRIRTDRFLLDYATMHNSFNEPWDTYDHENIFLARNSNFGRRASFNPILLAEDHLPANANETQNQISFRPVFTWDRTETGGDVSGVPDPNNTANQNFPNVVNPFTNIGSVPHKIQSRPLDVDNDLDGVMDSAWIDIGLDPYANEEGVLVKPLFAPMIVQLDSRININAAGTIADAQAKASVAAHGGFMTTNTLIGPNQTTPVNSGLLARGTGLGPAEISMTPVYGSINPAGPRVAVDYSPLLVGRTANGTVLPTNAIPAVPGRYGLDRFPGDASFDLQAAFRFLHYPSTGVLGRTFQSRPMDIQGRFGMGFPTFFETFSIQSGGSLIPVTPPVGMPSIDLATSTWPPSGPSPASTAAPGTELFNIPYEASLLSGVRRSDDQLFTAKELEGVLRRNDIDNGAYPSRLEKLGVPLDNPANTALITTESYEVPALPPTPEPLQQILYEILIDNGVNHNQALLHINGGFTGPTNAPTAYFPSLLSPDVLRNLPMNINRQFGNGRDDNGPDRNGDNVPDGNGIVDEHWDSANFNLNEQAEDAINTPAVLGDRRFLNTNPTVLVDANNDGLVDRQDRFARQIFARHLYMLAWLTTGEYSGTPGDAPDPPDMNADGLRDGNDIIMLAQWAINVVDYRDPDAICTPFEFDVNPWNGWDPDNILNAGEEPVRSLDFGTPANNAPNTFANEQGLVWGMERPELLLTEAMATHERRYTDENSDTVANESRFVPKASVFVELYNPWLTNPRTERPPAEFYDANSDGLVTAAEQGVDLKKTVDGDPLWRLAFTPDRDTTAVDALSRRVYFAIPDNTVEASDSGNFYTYDSDPGTNGVTLPEIPAIRPNQYAVIGSGGVVHNGNEYRTTFGRRTDATMADLMLDQTRSITLVPDSNPANAAVEVYKWDEIAGVFQRSTRNNVVAIPITLKNRGTATQDRSLAISDPINGYNSLGPVIDIDPDADGDPDDGDGREFSPALTNNADGGRANPRNGVSLQTNNAIFTEGLSTAVQYVKLQRLANPLAAFNEITNPYITVDLAPVDLVSLNGVLAGDEVTTTTGGSAIDSLSTCERGHGNPNERFLWPEAQPRTATSNLTTVTDHVYVTPLEESFGRMNVVDRGINASVQTRPFAWYAWNNRPYVSQYELANVSHLDSSSVLASFNPKGSTEVDPTGVAVDVTHLPPFSDSKLKRMLGFMEAKSRFINVDLPFNAQRFQGEWRVNPASGRLENPSVFNAPWNYISRYRIPGKININGFVDEEEPIWSEAMMLNWGVSSLRLRNTLRSLSRTPAVPTDYENVPISPTNGYLSTIPPAAVEPGLRDAVGVSDPIRPDGFANFSFPLAVPDPTPAVDTSDPSPDSTLLRSQSTAAQNLYRISNAPHDNTDRNFWFKNASVSKLANISTNRSSVFAIWITVGYFEVDSEGRLGAEVGADAGEAKRSRGFFIFDRSIPVAYEPGKNHNIDKAIIVKSIIE